MILKNLTRRSGTAQLVNYLFKENKNEKITPLVKHNLRSKDAKGLAEEFDANFDLRLHRRKDNIRLHHSIISFSNKDKEHISTSLLRDIANRFIELRGIDTQYLASVHNDKDHTHIHLIASAYKFLTGVSNRMTRQEFQELKIQLQAYQKEKYPDLRNSLPRHRDIQKSKSIEKPSVQELKSSRQTHKESILQNLEATYTESNSLDHFLSELKSYGYEPYYRGGSLYGIEEDGLKFRFNTLGYDKDKLEELDKKEASKEEDELEELRDLRESKSAENELENPSDSDEFDGRGL